MKPLYLLALLLLTLPAYAQTNPSNHTWVLDKSTLTYHMTHPIHQVDGVSHAAKGKGFCHDGMCDFLLAAPVRSFDSGDTNRDLHMLQVTRGGEFPLVTVRFRLPESAIDSPTLDCDLSVDFAGHIAQYSHVLFHQDMQGNEHHITGVVPSTLTDFQIPAPSFLAVPIKNEIPVRVDTFWHRQ